MSFTLPTRKAVPRGTPHLGDEEFWGCYPALAAILGAPVDGDGHDRQGGTLTIFAEAGDLKAVIRDRHAGMALFGTLDPVKGLYDQVEAWLQNHPERWRPDKAPKK